VKTAEDLVRSVLDDVMDPELPTVRITDLGVVDRVAVTDAAIEVDLLPTFSGCPALDIIRSDVEQALLAVADGRDIVVRFVTTKPWTTDRMNERAHDALKEYGVSPPGDRTPVPLVQIRVACPFCGSLDTAHESTFGPTLCRAVRYCNACRNPFEAFKPK
jgi:ring-1,2-phenylacetyl-CoA epoxidase subunit PaaD